MDAPVYIVDEIAAVVAKVNTALTSASFGYGPVYYMYGHPKEISNRLQQLTDSPTEAHKKFPLVILFTDITIEIGAEGFYGATKLRMLVCNITEANYISEQRTELNFKPIIHPIKDELIKQLSLHKQFTYEGELQYKETDMYFYGSQINNNNVFNDRVDGTELKDITLNIKLKC
jgi:hypothetical protein